MAEELTEEEVIAKFNAGEKFEEVINKDDPSKTTPATPTDTPVEPEKTYWEQKGFASQEELDTYIESRRHGVEPEYKSQYAKELDTFAKVTGKDDPETFQFYKNTEVKDTMEPMDYIDLLVKDHVLKNPEFKGDEDIIKDRFIKQYLVDMDPTDEALTKEDLFDKKMKTIELKKSAETVVNEIKEIKTKIANNGVTPEEIAERQSKIEQSKTKWNDELNKAAENFKVDIFDEAKNKEGKFEFLQTDKDEPVVLKSFTFGDEEKEFYKSSLGGVINQMGYPEPDSENAKMAQKIAEMATFYEFRGRLIKEVIAQTKSSLIKEDKIEADNPSKLKIAASTDNPEGILSEEEAVKRAMNG
jgi:hypothetical protein